MKIDRIFYVCFTGYPERAARMERVAAKAAAALGAPAERIWQTATPWNRWILERAPHDPFMDRRPGCFGATVGQYRAVRTAWELGSQGALLMEDDCRFRKGADLRAALEGAPEADALMLDHFCDRGVDRAENGAARNDRGGNAAAQDWLRAERAASSACWALSRDGMEKMLRCYDAAATGEGPKAWRTVRNCDNWTDARLVPGLRIFVAAPNLAVQVPCPDGSSCGAGHMIGKYARMGIDLGDYDGYDE